MTNNILLVAFELPHELLVSGVASYPSPWGIPLATGLRGTYSSEEVLILHEEWPPPFAPQNLDWPKRYIEVMHVRKFDSDYRFKHGGRGYFHELKFGGDPPDFLAETDGGVLGVECTSLTLTERRGLNGLFQGIRQAIMDAHLDAFVGVRGCLIRLDFRSKDGNTGKPFKKDDYPSIDKLLDALNSYVFDFESRTTTENKPPESLDLLGVVNDSLSEVRFYANPLVGSAPDSSLFALRGFEIVLGYPSSHSVSAIRAELERLVVKHDKPGVDVLLVTCGGPARDGYTYPSEELVGRLFVDYGRPLDLAKHVKTVLLHFWSTGCTWEIMGHKDELVPPIYLGRVPYHRPWVPSKKAVDVP